MLCLIESSAKITENAVCVDLRIDGQPRVVTPELAATLLRQYPNLALHACKSGRQAQTPATPATPATGSPAADPSPTGSLPASHATTGLFAEKIVGALLPHLVEHLAIELLVQADGPEIQRPYAGNTVWLSQNDSTMRVRVSYYDAKTTERALQTAISQVNRLCEKSRQSPLKAVPPRK
jgi:hypothetical protein